MKYVCTMCKNNSTSITTLHDVLVSIVAVDFENCSKTKNIINTRSKIKIGQIVLIYLFVSLMLKWNQFNDSIENFL